MRDQRGNFAHNFHLLISETIKTELDEIELENMGVDEMTVGQVVIDNTVSDTQPSLGSHQTEFPSTAKRKKKIQRRIHLDHIYEDSPQTLKVKLEKTLNLLIRERTLNAALTKKTKRLTIRLNNLMDIVRELEEKIRSGLTNKENEIYRGLTKKVGKLAADGRILTKK